MTIRRPLTLTIAFASVGVMLQACAPTPSGPSVRLFHSDFQGIAKTIDSRVDPSTRAVDVRAEVPNPDGTLQQGMLLTATLVLEQRPAAMLIPEEALVPVGDEQFIYVVEDGKAAQKKIVLGERLRGSVEVREGLSADAKVIVGGLQRLRDGTPVRETSGVLPMQGS